MHTGEILPIEHETLVQLFRMRFAHLDDEALGRRREMRWPFKGTVELWIPGPEDTEIYRLATCLNLSLRGVGIQCEDELREGSVLDLAIHQPELSLHGKARVRHCTLVEEEYVVGLEFNWL